MKKNKKLQRQLKSRHLSMMALGGTIGTGLLLASGSVIHDAGPGGAILGYLLVGFLVYFVMTSLGEMASYSPVTGSFCDYSAKLIDKAFGFAMSWNYWISWTLVVAIELIAAGIVMQYWFPATNPLLWTVLFFAFIIILNLISVRLYGETEYWMSFIKVATIVIFILVATLAIIGILGSHNSGVGFKNITIGDAPFHAGFMGFVSVFLVAGFSFQGTELVGVAVGEVKNPGKSIPKAIRSIFWRIMIFYILTITVIAFLIPYTNPLLINESSTNVTMSPFTIIFSSVGLKYAASIMNVVVITAILSNANASLYTASRVMWHIGDSKSGPSFLAKINSKGVPLAAVVISSFIAALFLISSVIGSGLIFIWLINIIGLAGYIAWFGICLSHYRFRKSFILQGNKLSQLPFVARWFPIAPICAMALIIIMMVGGQISDIIYGNFSWQTFIANYSGVLLFIILYLGYKLTYKTKVIPLEECKLNIDAIS